MSNKMVRKGLLILVMMFMMFFTKPAFAWVGLGYYTHEALAKDAIYVLPASEYPDLYRFEEELKDGSESEDAHGKGSCGGNVKMWWEDIALLSYKASNFSTAYLQIGQVCHLTQDQAVPAHAANIRHGFAGIKTHMDDFEGWAYGHYVSSPSDGHSHNIPFKYYQELQDDTRGKLSGWIKPSTQEQYWIPSKNAPALGVDATLETSGKYQGEYGGKGRDKDIYCSGKWPVLWGCESPEIAEDQIYMATRHSAGVFAAASRKLPPFVKYLEIAPSSEPVPVIDFQTGNEISFKILENRKQNVKIFITVDSKDGEPIIGLEYGTGKSFDLSSGTDLPWEGTYSVIWDGKLANGQYPSGGQHTLYVRIEDEDGNSSDVATHDFTIIFTSVAIYNADADGGISHGDKGIYSALAAAQGITPYFITDLDLSLLQNYDVLVMPDVHSVGPDEIGWIQNIRNFANQGGGVLLTHDSIGGTSISPSGPIFPEIATCSGWERNSYTTMVITASHPVTEGFSIGQTYTIQFSDHVIPSAGANGLCVVKDIGGYQVIIVGEFGNGRVVASGDLFGLNPDYSEVPPTGGELQILLNSIKYLGR